MRIIKVQALLLLSILFCSLTAATQTIQIVDKDSRQSIPGVVILNESKNKGVLSDAEGKADISQFKENSVLTFRHSSYLERRIPLAQISAANYLVELTENVVLIQEVVVSANRWEQKQDEIPNDILAISARDIALQNPQTTADMLQQTGEVFVQKSQQGGGSPMLRGFAANSVLLVVDGIRMNNAIYRSGNLQNVINLDANILEGAEVIFGPGSVIYGSDALGGVMDFHTKTPLLNTKPGVRVEGSGLMRYATVNNEKTVHADISLGWKKFSALSSISFSDFGDLRSGKNGFSKYPYYFGRPDYVVRQNDIDLVIENPEPELQLGSGYNQINLLQKFRYVPTDDLDFIYSFHYTTSSNIPRYDRLTQRSEDDGRQGALRFAEWYYGPQEWMLHSLQTNLYQSNRFYEQARFTAGYQQYKECRHSRRFNRLNSENQYEALDLLTLNADFNLPFANKKQLFYGVEGAFNWVSSVADTSNIFTGVAGPIAPRYGNKGNNTQSLSAYASIKYPLSNSLVLNAGTRYTWYQLESNFSDQFYPFPFEEIALQTTALNGNLGLAYSKNKLRFDFLVSTGFRAPNVDDVSKIFDPAPGTVTVPNPNLKPEYSYNAESTLGYEGTKLRASFTAYATLLDNAIVRRPSTFNGQPTIDYQGEIKEVEALVNTGKGVIAGGSFSLRYRPLERLLLATSLTYSWGEDSDTGERLRHIPPVFGQTSATYQRKNWSLVAQMRYNGAISWQDLPSEEQSKGNLYAPEGTIAWTVFDLKANWKPKSYLEVSSGIENILDLHYRPYSSGISAPGRNFYLSLRTYF